MKRNKLISILLAVVMMFSMSCVGVLAAEDDVIDVGDIVEYNMYFPDGTNSVRLATTEERIQKMINEGRTPGSTFNVGKKLYEVTSDYELKYLGEGFDGLLNNLQSPITRGTVPPTSLGYLPYPGTYNISTYLYTNRYFNVSGSNPWIGVNITTDDSYHVLNIHFVDGRNDESMQISRLPVYPGQVNTVYGNVYSGVNFYVKIQNLTTSRWVYGNFNIFRSE